ncbi:hypothetical protein [Methylocystis echinoides]|uniref:Uncharacterized protein n=1 Tax=Methylocystis echinoides TaxID=29468 RepID=A0A9W6GS89_9HYPH|nr:hypothetical protein [Methylocystis echinoides]GLI92069.1 hypothetical protein LMG27198_10610 [Methylocystis echinoides]
MSIGFSLHSALPPNEALQRIAQTRLKYGEMLRYFWISEVGEAGDFTREADADYGFVPKSTFLIQWTGERSEFIRRIPPAFYEIFGKDNILIFDDTCDPVPPPSN